MNVYTLYLDGFYIGQVIGASHKIHGEKRKVLEVFSTEGKSTFEVRILDFEIEDTNQFSVNIGR